VPLLDPTDLRGLPYFKDGFASWAPPSFLPSQSDSAGVLFSMSLTPHHRSCRLRCNPDEEVLPTVLGDLYALIVLTSPHALSKMIYCTQQSAYLSALRQSWAKTDSSSAFLPKVSRRIADV